ncbi:right-handed parallel beta-helix repeat-containing protein [Nonomuraea sp. NPDC049655]|uniref:right-handed parallel beta-helix repeat-containing protein n=1 Tax=Nonomuraea sp. NPDC049655 TaxID=3364355 RepID=UPI0037B323AC
MDCRNRHHPRGLIRPLAQQPGTRQDACLLSGLRLVDGLITIDRCTVTKQTVTVRGTGSAIRNSTLTGGSLTVSATDQGTFTRNVFDAFPMGLSNDSRRNLVQANVFKNLATAGLGAAETFLPQDANTIEDNEFTGNDIGLSSSSMLRHIIVRRNVFNGNNTAGHGRRRRRQPGPLWLHPQPRPDLTCW